MNNTEGLAAAGNEREPAFKASGCDLDDVDSASRNGKNCPRKERNGTEKERQGEMTVGGQDNEIKALSGLHDKHRAQVHNYLKATGLRVGPTAGELWRAPAT